MDAYVSDNSSTFADQLLYPYTSSFNSSLQSNTDKCSRSTTGILILTVFSFTNILIMFPVSILVFYLGFLRWKQQHSTAAAPTTSSSDVFTYNMTAMVLIEVSGSVLYCVGGYAKMPDVISFLYDFFCTLWSMKMQFHVLTCVERYLAVVHPVTYLGLKNKSGDRIRRMSIGGIWLQFIILVGLIPVTSADVNLTVFFCYLLFALIVVSFCSVSVLCALKRPGPGEVGGNREQVDQLKQRAFHTITAIIGTLLFSLGGVLTCSAMYVSSLLSYSDSCVAMMSFVWFSLPGSLVLPLLYLQRSGKVPSCTQKEDLA